MKNETTFKKRWDSSYKGTPFKNDSGVSMTQPSMSLTVRELMTRHTRGLEIGVPSKQEIYLDDNQEVPRHDDLVDVLEAREALEDKKKELEKQMENERLQRQAEKLERERKAQEVSQASEKEPGSVQ